MTLLGDFHEDSHERRMNEERDTDAYRAWSARVHASPKLPYCLKCGGPLDLTRAYGGLWYFDRGSTKLHRCGYRRPIR